MSAERPHGGLIRRWHERLPVSASTREIELGEGGTPLIQLHNIPAALGLDIELHVKFEGLNPTGSFKDRGMTMAVTQAVSEGAEAIICASTGNTSAAAAAYAARAGITAFVLIPDGKIAQGKLAQAMMHGAVVIQIRGNFDAGMALVKQVAETAPVTIVNSINPYRLQGQKTAAFEIVEHCPRGIRPRKRSEILSSRAGITLDKRKVVSPDGRTKSTPSLVGGYHIPQGGAIDHDVIPRRFKADGSGTFLEENVRDKPR